MSKGVEAGRSSSWNYKTQTAGLAQDTQPVVSQGAVSWGSPGGLTVTLQSLAPGCGLGAPRDVSWALPRPSEAGRSHAGAALERLWGGPWGRRQLSGLSAAHFLLLGWPTRVSLTAAEPRGKWVGEPCFPSRGGWGHEA